MGFTGQREPKLGQNAKAFNPYPHLGCPDSTCWPRGHPLDQIREEVQYEWSYGKSKIGVLQSLADVQPDIDAIFRLTRKTPFNFIRPNLGELMK